MSLQLYATGLYYNRHREQVTARLHGGEIVKLQGADALAVQWPPKVEHIHYVPEQRVYLIQILGEGQRDMTRIEIGWCDAILQHLCRPAERVG